MFGAKKSQFSGAVRKSTDKAQRTPVETRFLYEFDVVPVERSLLRIDARVHP